MPPDTTTVPTGTAPSMSAAEALAGAPICRDLGGVALARLVPELEELTVAPGQAVYFQGDPADGLYLMRSGTTEMTVRTPSGDQEVSLLELPTCFGDVELLTGAMRQADVVARTPVAVWKLPRERFEPPVQEQPELPRQIAADLADRLAEQIHELGESREQLGAAARAVYRMLDPTARRLARQAALFDAFDERLLRDTLGETWSREAFTQLADEPAPVYQDEDGWYRFTTRTVRDFLLAQLRAEVGGPDLARWRRRAADLLLSRPDAPPELALWLLHAAEAWPRLADQLERHGRDLVKCAPQEVETLL